MLNKKITSFVKKLMSKQNLKDKTIKGVGWSAIDNVAQRGVSFLVSIVLARLLSPDDYGLLGIILIFTSISTALVDGGFTTALIRKKNATEDDYNTVFICNLGLSLVLYLLIFACAPLISNFFGREELVALTRVSSLEIVLVALSLVQRTRLTKRIDFKTQTKITFIASICSGVVGVVMALLGFGVWSLVAQLLVKEGLRMAFLWFFNRWVPRLKFSSASFKDLFGFGWKMMVSGLIDTLWKEFTQVVVARFYSPATLGQYSRSRTFAGFFSGNLTSVIQRVTYPVLSEIQDDKERMVSAYRRIIKTTMFVTVVCMFFLGSISEPLLYCLIGPQWHDAAVYLPLVCIASSMYPLHAINLNMLSVQGRSDLFLGLEIIKKIIGLGPLFVGAFIGIKQMLCLYIVTGFINYLLNSHYSGKLLGYSSWMQLKDVAPSYIVATIVALSVWFLKYLPISNWVILPLQIVVGATVFFAVCRISNMNEYNESKQLIAPFVNKIMKKSQKTTNQ